MRLLAFIGALAIIAALAATVYFFGGYYNVAATEPDSSTVAWALTRVRVASIEKHAKATPTPPIPIDDAAQIRAGARAFAERGCVTCHGAPGVDWSKFSEGLRPDPPDLKDVAKGLSPQEIFWVIKNGIKMTGMPGFGLINTGDRDIWTIVAFVKKLPNVSADEFKAWSQPAPASPPAPKR